MIARLSDPAFLVEVAKRAIQSGLLDDDLQESGA
jgi:hypothetical protein